MSLLVVVLSCRIGEQRAEVEATALDGRCPGPGSRRRECRGRPGTPARTPGWRGRRCARTPPRNEPQSVPQSVARPAATIAPAGVHDQVPFRTVTLDGRALVRVSGG